MPEKAWFESFFGEDYFEIYEAILTPEFTADEVGGIVSLLNLQKSERILDVACGHGRHSILLAKQGYDVTGYDLSEVFLDRARADAQRQGANVEGSKETCASCRSRANLMLYLTSSPRSATSTIPMTT